METVTYEFLIIFWFATTLVLGGSLLDDKTRREFVGLIIALMIVWVICLIGFISKVLGINLIDWGLF